MTALSVDFSGLSKAHVGAAGFDRQELLLLGGEVRQAVTNLVAAHEKGTLSFLTLPDDAHAHAAVREVVNRIDPAFDTMVVLGIGGSSLGPKALFSALRHPLHNLLPQAKRGGLRLFFPDNSDPSTFAALLDVIDLEKTVFAAITKSGGTAETWAQLLLVVERMGRERAKKHIIAVTDPAAGALRKVATQEAWPSLAVPPSVGGRFSVFSPVGLLPLAASGVDTAALLAGAGQMARRCVELDLFSNPAAMLATTLWQLDLRGRGMHVLMPYADSLRETGDWFVQLWAESLGKKKGETFVGPTPLRTVGATDQHSILQLLMEGPQNKVTMFIAVENPRVDLPIPRSPFEHPDVSYLGGHSFGGLLSAEQKATAVALEKNGRPTLTIRVPALTPNALGQLLMLFEAATGIAGSLYGVNAYDQPGVELGKRYTCGILGRPGYEASKTEFSSHPSSDAQWVV